MRWNQPRVYQPNQGVYQPNQGVYQPNQGVYQPNQGVYQPNQGVYQPNQGVYQPNQGYINQTKGISTKPRVMSTKPRGISTKPRVYQPNQGLCQPKSPNQHQGLWPSQREVHVLSLPHQRKIDRSYAWERKDWIIRADCILKSINKELIALHCNRMDNVNKPIHLKVASRI